MSGQDTKRTAAMSQSGATLDPAPAPGLGRDWAGEFGHHRYYGSSATNGGEQIIDTRRSRQARRVNVCGF